MAAPGGFKVRIPTKPRLWPVIAGHAYIDDPDPEHEVRCLPDGGCPQCLRDRLYPRDDTSAPPGWSGQRV